MSKNQMLADRLNDDRGPSLGAILEQQIAQSKLMPTLLERVTERLMAPPLGELVADHGDEGFVMLHRRRERKGPDSMTYFAWSWDVGTESPHVQRCDSQHSAEHWLGVLPPVGCEDRAGTIRLGTVIDRVNGGEVRKYQEGEYLLTRYFAWPAQKVEDIAPTATMFFDLKSARMHLGATYQEPSGLQGETKRLRAEENRAKAKKG